MTHPTPTELLALGEEVQKSLAEAIDTFKGTPRLEKFLMIERYINALTTLSAREDWQPIETAPKDGTLILGWFENPRWPSAPGVLQWIDHNGGGWTHYPMGTPTHWMPLPKAPTAGEGQPQRERKWYDEGVPVDESTAINESKQP